MAGVQRGLAPGACRPQDSFADQAPLSPFRATA
jgi:hypothetical protein